MRDGLRSRGHDCRIFASKYLCKINCTKFRHQTLIQTEKSCVNNSARLLSDRPLNAELLADYRCYGTSSRFRTLLQTTNLSALWQLGRILNEFQR